MDSPAGRQETRGATPACPGPGPACPGALSAEQKAWPAGLRVATQTRLVAQELRARQVPPARIRVYRHPETRQPAEQRGSPAATAPRGAELRQAALAAARTWVRAAPAVRHGLAQPAAVGFVAVAVAAPGKRSVWVVPRGAAPASPPLLGQALRVAEQAARQRAASRPWSAGMLLSPGAPRTPRCIQRSEPGRRLQAPWRDRLGRWWRNWGT
jgi:hypothetical protein